MKSSFRLILELIVKTLAVFLWGQEIAKKIEVWKNAKDLVDKTYDEHRSARATADGSRMRDDDPDLFADSPNDKPT